MLLEIRNNISEVDRICTSIQEFCTTHSISDSKCYDVTVIIDELATNIINYAYTDGQEHVFIFSIELKPDQKIYMQLIDDGVPFDPIKKSDPDTDLSLEDRPIGGLGIFFAKQLSESITYNRDDDKNMLTIIVSTKEEKPEETEDSNKEE